MSDAAPLLWLRFSLMADDFGNTFYVFVLFFVVVQIVVGYANGCVGYVPTEEEFPWGGYEVGLAAVVSSDVHCIARDSLL